MQRGCETKMYIILLMYTLIFTSMYVYFPLRLPPSYIHLFIPLHTFLFPFHNTVKESDCIILSKLYLFSLCPKYSQDKGTVFLAPNSMYCVCIPYSYPKKIVLSIINQLCFFGGNFLLFSPFIEVSFSKVFSLYT